MDKLQKGFLDFNDKITLSQSKKNDLVTSRDSLEETIKNWFKEKHPDCVPTFAVQGSFSMGTTLMQLDDGEYDIDLGVYLSGYEGRSISEYPSPQTVHTWINNATANETDANNIDKMTCVRVTYQKGYHIDLPSYIKDDFGKILLAHTRDGWIQSDPIEFTNWFNDCVNNYGEQLRRVVKYIKAWKDYRKMPIASIAITILACNNFVASNNKDYESLYKTVKGISSSLKYYFTCKKPVNPYEDVFADYSDSRKQTIIDGFDDFTSRMYKVIYNDDCEIKKSNIKRLFGDRFKTNCDEEFEKTEKPGVLKSDGRSA